MQEVRDHVRIEMIVVGKSVRLSDLTKKDLIGKGTYGTVHEYKSKRSGRKYAKQECQYYPKKNLIETGT